MAVWEPVQDPELEQGDFLPKCLVPVFPENFDPSTIKEGDTIPAKLEEFDLIIVTQTCDLVQSQNKTRRVALCPAYRLTNFEEVNKGFTEKRLPNVKNHRVYGLYYLPPIPEITGEDPFIIDFREIYNLNFAYVLKHAQSLKTRWSLGNTHREHFSRAFGDLFSRVAIPRY